MTEPEDKENVHAFIKFYALHSPEAHILLNICVHLRSKLTKNLYGSLGEVPGGVCFTFFDLFGGVGSGAFSSHFFFTPFILYHTRNPGNHAGSIRFLFFQKDWRPSNDSIFQNACLHVKTWNTNEPFCSFLFLLIFWLSYSYVLFIPSSQFTVSSSRICLPCVQRKGYWRNTCKAKEKSIDFR